MRSSVSVKYAVRHVLSHQTDTIRLRMHHIERLSFPEPGLKPITKVTDRAISRTRYPQSTKSMT